jgi:hypothetical protein
VMEIGRGQGAGVARSLSAQAGWDSVTTHPDEHGEIRVIEARCQAATGSPSP